MALLRELTPEQRGMLADKAGTTVNYLYHVSACSRQPRVGLAKRISEATTWANKRWGTPVITLDDLASMCRA
jgi:hypothetical protein